MPNFRSLPSDGERGFTLLELLVAMTLLGLLSVVLFGGLQFGTQVWRKSEDATELASKVRSAQSLLSETISRAYPYYVTSDPTNPHVDFEGYGDRLTFLAPTPAPAGALARVSIRAQTSDDGIMLRVVSEPELAIDQTGQTDRVILKGLKDVVFAYFGAADAKSAPSWQREWHDRLALPALVRSHAEFANRHAMPWPDLYIVPRISADMACNYDPITKFCQGR